MQHSNGKRDSTMKQWQGISEFVAVAEHKSFTGAAGWLGMSVAQVSRNVSELERRLQVRLFFRSTRQVRLSEEGRVYLQHCQHLVQGLDDANRAMGNLQQSPQGRLRITAAVYYGETIIAPLLNDFLVAHEEIELELELTNNRLDLIEGRFDLALRLGHLDDSSMVAKRLGRRRHYVVGSPQYLARYGVPKSPECLHNHQLLSGTLEYWRLSSHPRVGKSDSMEGGDQQPSTGIKSTSSARMVGPRAHTQIKPHSRLRCNSGVALLDAVKKGHGLAQLPDYYVLQDIQAGRLRAVLTEYHPDDDGIWALYPQNRHLSPKVRAVVEYLGNRL